MVEKFTIITNENIPVVIDKILINNIPLIKNAIECDNVNELKINIDNTTLFSIIEYLEYFYDRPTYKVELSPWNKFWKRNATNYGEGNIKDPIQREWCIDFIERHKSNDRLSIDKIGDASIYLLMGNLTDLVMSSFTMSMRIKKFNTNDTNDTNVDQLVMDHYSWKILFSFGTYEKSFNYLNDRLNQYNLLIKLSKELIKSCKWLINYENNEKIHKHYYELLNKYLLCKNKFDGYYNSISDINKHLLLDFNNRISIIENNLRVDKIQLNIYENRKKEFTIEFYNESVKEVIEFEKKMIKENEKDEKKLEDYIKHL